MKNCKTTTKIYEISIYKLFLFDHNFLSKKLVIQNRVGNKIIGKNSNKIITCRGQRAAGSGQVAATGRAFEENHEFILCITLV